jgi:hypothetical protein
LLYHYPDYLSAYVLKLKDGKIRGTFLPNKGTARIQRMAHGIIRVFKTYHNQLLVGVVNSGLKIREFLKILMLKDVGDNVGLI